MRSRVLTLLTVFGMLWFALASLCLTYAALINFHYSMTLGEVFTHLVLATVYFGPSTTWPFASIDRVYRPAGCLALVAFSGVESILICYVFKHVGDIAIHFVLIVMPMLLAAGLLWFTAART